MLSPLFSQHVYFSIGSFPDYCAVGWNDAEFTKQSYREIKVTCEQHRFELHSLLGHGVLLINTYNTVNL